MRYRLCLLLLMLGMHCFAQQANWTGPYQPCRDSFQLKTTGYLRIGVRYDISDNLVIQEFRQALAFWARVLDAAFYDEPSSSCAIAVVYGTENLVGGLVVARAQFPDRTGFQGWIAIDRKAATSLSSSEAVATWTHEIGHVLGLKHNTSPRSLMYFLDVDSGSRLDAADIQALRRIHSLREDIVASQLSLESPFKNSSNRRE